MLGQNTNCQPSTANCQPSLLLLRFLIALDILEGSMGEQDLVQR